MRIFFTILTLLLSLHAQAQVHRDTLLPVHMEDNPETLPEYPGGQAAMLNFINANLHYPTEAIAQRAEGLVLLSVPILNTGAVGEQIEIVRDPGGSLAAEVVRVVRLMPKWKPATKENKSVNAWQFVAIRMVLPSNLPTTAAADSTKTPPKPVVADKPARFFGGDKALNAYLFQNIQYPKRAYKDGVQGIVVVRVSLDAAGKVTGAAVQKKLSPELDEEALRLAKNMPDWEAAIQNGAASASEADFQIRFHLPRK